MQNVTRLPVPVQPKRRAGKSGPPAVDVPKNLRSLDDLRLELGTLAIAKGRAELLLEWAEPAVGLCREIDTVSPESALFILNNAIKRAEQLRDSMMCLAHVRETRKQARMSEAG